MESPVKLWRNQGRTRQLLGKRGKILAWTIVRVPPSGFSAFAPYPVVIVAADSMRVTCQLVDWDQKNLRQNQEVEFVVRRVREATSDGIIPYGIKAKPVTNSLVIE